MLDYKLAIAGLAKPKEVSAAYTSQTCPCCGFKARENRPKLPDGDGFKVDRFICQTCSYEHDADLNAARVIALKRLWREALSPAQRTKLMSELSEKHSFETYLRNRAAMRDDGPCDRKVGTSGGHGLSEAGPHPEGQKPEGSLATAPTPWRGKKTAATLPQLSSSSGIPPLPLNQNFADSIDKDDLG